MKMIEVQSSNIKKVGYDKNNLYVEYNSGTYEYTQVPKQLYEDLLKAESKGRFMNENIKGKYIYKKIA